MMNEAQAKAHELYKSACAADDALSAAIRKIHGGRANRYDITANDYKNPEIRAALDAKYAADEAFRATFAHNGAKA